MISEEETKYIAELARLNLSDEELQKIGKDLSGILDYVKKLSEVDTKNILPLNGGTDFINQMRNDVQKSETVYLRSPETVASLVNAAPAKEKGYVKVK